jgi:hypothetical protein
MSTARDIFESLPSRFDPRYRVVPGTCQFRIEGPAGGDYYTTCAGAAFAVSEGVCPSADCTVSMPDADFVGWCHGRLRDQDLLASDRLRIAGDPELLFSMAMMMFTGATPELRAAIRAVEERFRGRPMIGEVERVTELAPSRLREAARAKTPLLLAGGTRSWRASSWSLESLKERFGHVPFPVRRISASSPWVALLPREGPPGAARGAMRLADFVDAILGSSPGDPDVPHTDLMELPDELAGEIGPLPAFPDQARSRRRPELFLSAAGAYTGVHRDFEDGASCVLIGRRRFRLWSPDQADRLYAMPNLHPKFQGCFLDARHPDPARFPLFERAVSVEVTVEPGDVLYLPFGWFHDVTAVEHGLTIRLDYPDDFHAGIA